ncbi:MAG: DUF975 family protein [Clostridiaceae bacterium]|nr:DUF975 family protein [Clostridiaceae bacterium]
MDFSYLKTNAKNTLANFYWTAFFVCLIVSIVSSISIDFGFRNNEVAFWTPDQGTQLYRYLSNQDTIFEVPLGDPDLGSLTVSLRSARFSVVYPINSLFMLIAMSAMVFNLAMYFCVHNVFKVGQKKYFIEASRGNSSLSYLTSFYGNGKWASVSAKLFQVDLVIFLWSLLFIIPGIIKAYQYIMVPYILAEFPDMPVSEAKQNSRMMTDGNKIQIFILGLSFIGWYLLGLMMCCVGAIFVTPYVEATFAELYDFLKGTSKNQNE